MQDVSDIPSPMGMTKHTPIYTNDYNGNFTTAYARGSNTSKRLQDDHKVVVIKPALSKANVTGRTLVTEKDESNNARYSHLAYNHTKQR